MEEHLKLPSDGIGEAVQLYHGSTQYALLTTGDFVAIKRAATCITIITSKLPYNNNILEELRQYLWECMHLSQWSCVHLGYREAYGLSCFLLASSLYLKSPNETETIINIADSGILMGNIVYCKLLQQLIAVVSNINPHIKHPKSRTRDSVDDDNVATKKRKTRRSMHKLNRSVSQSKVTSITYETIQPSRRSSLSIQSSSSISRHHQPDLLTFYQSYFLAQKPLVLTGCMEDWDALQLWKDPEYISKGIYNYCPLYCKKLFLVGVMCSS
jgi:hypothetical protein